ncbi:hypothetical protein ACB092_11G192200 [Castanea dentata]
MTQRKQACLMLGMRLLSVLHLMAMLSLSQANLLLLPRTSADGYQPKVSEAKKQYKTSQHSRFRSKEKQKDQHQSRPQLDSITKKPQSLQKILPKILLVKFIKTSNHLYKSCKRNST